MNSHYHKLKKREDTTNISLTLEILKIVKEKSLKFSNGLKFDPLPQQSIIKTPRFSHNSVIGGFC